MLEINKDHFDVPPDSSKCAYYTGSLQKMKKQRRNRRKKLETMPIKKLMKTKLLLFFSLLLFLVACSPSVDTSPTSTPTTQAPLEATLPSPILADREIDFVSNTHIQHIATQTDLLSAIQIDIPLAQPPAWIAGIPHTDGTIWAVAFDDGNLSAYLVDKNGYEELEVTPDKIAAGMPLTIYSSGGLLYALSPLSADAAPFSPPVLIKEGSPDTAHIASNGDLVIQQGDAITHLSVNALPDSRILVDEEGRFLFLSQPTNGYDHGVLGDGIEATGITLVATQPEPKILQTISISAGDVIEGIYPIWADLNDDGEREIIVTLSNAQEGARIVAYREDGSLLAESEPIGTGYRWRHQLVATPFGENDDMLLAVVRTPHIVGVIEYYRLNGNSLEIVETTSGFSTHSIGSRNLFTAQAGDFDNDGKIELLIPDQSHTRLGIVGLDGEPVAWLNLNAELITNLAAVEMPENKQVVTAGGLSTNVLRVWVQ